MEMVVTTANSAGAVPVPFQRHDVQEWSSLNRLTGMLEHARVETDHWAAKTQNTAHNYGKVVDSRNLSASDGSNNHRARRQLEVFQAKVPGGSVQVIRTQTVASTSSRWSSRTAGATAPNAPIAFADLKLACNPLDNSSQKTKANVGRSGSIGGRRPPTRPRTSSIIIADEDDVVTSRLERVSRLCQQVHDENTNNNNNYNNTKNSEIMSALLDKTPLQFNSASLKLANSPNHIEKSSSALTASKYCSSSSDASSDTQKSQLIKNPRFLNPTEPPKSPNLFRYSRNPETSRTNTNSFLSRTTLGDSHNSRTYLDSDSSNFLTRTLESKTNYYDMFRNKRLPDAPDADTDRRLSAALRGNNVDLEALDQILKSISSKSETDANTATQPKRKSFVTIESLKEVKGRLRRLSSADEEANQEVDDGIVAEALQPVSKVRSYVYGMEALLHKKPGLGTGSLESRTSSKSNGSNSSRTEDWYNRRKSYGFERVHNQQIDTSNISLRSKNKIESSTDSGICRSTELAIGASVTKPQFVPKSSTVINLSSEKPEAELTQEHELYNVWNRRAINSDESELTRIKIPITTDHSNSKHIPITSELLKKDPESSARVFQRQISEGTSISVESWPKDPKRHSIAVDESKYVHRNPVSDVPKHRRISLALADDPYDFDDETSHFGRKAKRVEFCKTEVHFAAESGRVNIVETDEKPPPTQNFRRRRRTNSTITSNHVPDETKTGLPLIHFGDTLYEKKLFGLPSSSSSSDDSQLEVAETFNKDVKTASGHEVTVSFTKDYEIEASTTLESDTTPRSILKNKMIKPKPYILGDLEPEDDNIWGVRLRPVHKPEEASPPIWRSTVTVQNTAYASPEVLEAPKPEFQKLLHSLRPSRKSESSIPGPDEAKSTLDLRRSSWSVADRVKQVEDLKETKGYSTKVNFGSGEATVIENSDSKVTQWPTAEETSTKEYQFSKSSFYLEKSKNTQPSNRTCEILTKDSMPVQKQPTSRIQVTPSPLVVGIRKEIVPEVEVRSSAFKKIASPSLRPKSAAYGAKPLPKTKLWNKPDLLQHYNNREYVNLSTVIQKPSPSIKTKLVADLKRVKSTKRPDSPIVQRSESPIYENIDEVLSGLHSGLKQESAILAELTRAADQILQAVNGYTDSDSDKTHRLNLKQNEQLATISETKSWRTKTTTKKQTNTKTKVKPTSSNSSIESVSAVPLPPVRVNRAAKLTEDKNRKKITGSNAELSKVTKARRLQRASSREALLQSHGSSSEDITGAVQVRKPRVTRKGTRATSADEKSGVSQLKKKDHEVQSVTRVSGLQEIRHKMAVSTIKSTAEKAAIRGTKKKDSNMSKGVFVSTQQVRPGSTSTPFRGDLSTQYSTLSTVRTSKGVGARKASRLTSIQKS